VAATPRTIVERFLDEVMSGGRPESAPDLVDSEPLMERVRALRAAFPDLRVHVVRITVDGDLVAVHLAGGGTHRGAFQGSLATGRRWAATGTAIYAVRAGRIADFWLTWDMLSILEQLGLVLRPADVSA
jgi:predicted ester cyclase